MNAIGDVASYQDATIVDVMSLSAETGLNWLIRGEDQDQQQTDAAILRKQKYMDVDVAELNDLIVLDDNHVDRVIQMESQMKVKPRDELPQTALVGHPDSDPTAPNATVV